MKLDNLKDTNLHRAMKTNLVIEVNDEDGIMDTEIFIITDVPRITQKQFNKLYDISFKETKPKNFLTIEQFAPYNTWAENQRPEKMEWKKFVHHMQTYYNPWWDDQDNEDDFDE